MLAKLFTPILKLLGFGTKKLATNFHGFKFLKSMNISVNKEQFDQVYFETILAYESSVAAHPDFIKILQEGRVKSSFLNDLNTNGGSNAFITELDTIINVRKQYNHLIAEGVILENAASAFINLFYIQVNKTRTPKEKETNDKVANIETMVTSLLNKSSLRDIGDIISDFAILRKENNHPGFLKALQEVKDKRWDTLSDESKYKLLFNIATTQYELGNTKEAAKLYIDLLPFNLRPGETYAFAAIGYSAIEDYVKADEYAEKALSINKDNPYAYLVKFFAREKTLNTDEIDDLIPKHIQEKPQVGIVLADFLQRKKDYSRANILLEKLATEYSVEDSFKYDIMARIGGNMLAQIALPENLMADGLSQEEMDKAHQAFEKLNNAWNYFEQTPFAKQHNYVLVNRAVAYRLIREQEKAIIDFRASIRLQPTYFAYRHLMQIFIEDINESRRLITEMGKLPLKYNERQELLLMKTYTTTTAAEDEELLTDLRKEHSHVTDLPLKRQYYISIIRLLGKLEKKNELTRYLDEFLQAYPKDPLAHTLAAQVAIDENNVDEAKRRLFAAVELTDKTTEKQAIAHLASLLFNVKEYATAAKLLSETSDPTLLDMFNEYLIVAWGYSGNYKAALERATSLLKLYPDSQFLVEQVSTIYEKNEQFDNAIQAIDNYLELDPNNPSFLLKKSRNLYKKSAFDQMEKVLDQITDYENQPLPIQFMIADGYIQTGNYLKGLELAYQARNKNYSKKQTHVNYIKLHTRLSQLKQSDFYPGTVGNESFVSLIDDSGNVVEFILTANPTFNNEIDLTEPVAQLLYGKNIGDKVTLGGADYSIQSIKWKYTYAMNDSMNQIQTRFNNKAEIQVHRTPKDTSPKEILSQLFPHQKEHDQFEQQTNELYINGQSTVGVNSNLLKISPIKYWARLINSGDLGVYSSGNDVEKVTAFNLLDAQTPVIWDITSLLSVYFIKGQHLFSQIKNKQLIADSTLTLIREEIASLEHEGANDQLSVQRIGDQFYKQVVTKEEKLKYKNEMTAFLQFIWEHIEISYPDLPEDSNKKEEMDKIIGKSFHDTALIAKEKNALLISDDAFFRMLTLNDFGNKGTSVGAILEYLTVRKVLSKSGMNELMVKLIMLNYRYIPVNEEIILQVLQKCDYSVHAPFINACGIINKENLEDAKAIMLVVLFLYNLYATTSIASAKFDFAAQFIINKMFQGRDVAKLKPVFVQLIKTKFKLLPIHELQILEIVNSLSS
jgi:Tfp pilus assembly protein PilF